MYDCNLIYNTQLYDLLNAGSDTVTDIDTDTLHSNTLTRTLAYLLQLLGELPSPSRKENAYM